MSEPAPNVRTAIPFIGVCTAAIAISQSIPAPALADDPGGERPNIVYILADDLGYGDLSCLNAESMIPTPNMDRIAAEGMCFTDAHSGSAVCTPTRYGVLTGRYAWRTWMKSGVLMGYDPPLIETGRMTVASLLKENGYRTACIGKWHLGLGWVAKDREAPPPRTNTGDNVDFTQPITSGPLDVGFDYYFGIPASLDMAPYCYVENDRVTRQPDSQIDRSSGAAFWRKGAIADDFTHEGVLPKLTEKAVTYLDRAIKSTEDEPFFLYFLLTAPHTPHLPLDEFRGRSEAGVYGDFVTQVDWTVGQILEALDRNGLANNTLLIMASDNGADWAPGKIEKYGHRANYISRGRKADIWEGGHRIPFIARWPGQIAPGTSSDETVCLNDLLATCAAITGETIPSNAGEDSFNILPAMLGAELDGPIREATVHHSFNGTFAIRRGDWKLILGLGSGGFSKPKSMEPEPDGPRGQLYNLASDPSETTNLYLSRPDLVQQLTSLLEQYQRQGHSRPDTR